VSGFLLASAFFSLGWRDELRNGDGKAHSNENLWQFEHGDCLSHLTLRSWQWMQAFRYGLTLASGVGMLDDGALVSSRFVPPVPTGKVKMNSDIEKLER
jgi:hypothetical protein